MKHLGAVLAVGITAVIILTLGAVNFLMVSGAPSAPNTGDLPANMEAPTAVPDVAAVQAAFEAREKLLQAQIADLDAELENRQAAYDQHAAELNGLIAAGEEQINQLHEQETSLQAQIEQLNNAQAERTAVYESQRQQAYYQYQVNSQQLQAQLDEGKAKLSEALAQLGQ